MPSDSHVADQWQESSWLKRKRMADDLVSKRNAKAPIWQYFGFKPNANSQPENVNEAICKLCLMKVAASGGNTSNLYTHLQVHHKN